MNKWKICVCSKIELEYTISGNRFALSNIWSKNLLMLSWNNKKNAHKFELCWFHGIGQNPFSLFSWYILFCEFRNRNKLHHLNQRWVLLFQPALIKKRGTKRATRRHRGAFEGIFLRLQVGPVAENRWWTCAAVQPQTLTFLTGSTSPSSKGSSLSLPFFSSASQRSSVSSCRKKNRCGVGAKSKGRYRVSTLHPLW